MKTPYLFLLIFVALTIFLFWYFGVGRGMLKTVSPQESETLDTPSEPTETVVDTFAQDALDAADAAAAYVDADGTLPDTPLETDNPYESDDPMRAYMPLDDHVYYFQGHLLEDLGKGKYGHVYRLALYELQNENGNTPVNTVLVVYSIKQFRDYSEYRMGIRYDTTIASYVVEEID